MEILALGKMSGRLGLRPQRKYLADFFYLVESLSFNSCSKGRHSVLTRTSVSFSMISSMETRLLRTTS